MMKKEKERDPMKCSLEATAGRAGGRTGADMVGFTRDTNDACDCQSEDTDGQSGPEDSST